MTIRLRKALGHASTLFFYFLIPGLGVVTPILVYPAITSEFGSAGFAGMAVAQSIGATVAVVCELGWNVVGPQTVARQAVSQRLDYYQSSIATRTMALCFGAPVAAVLGAIISPDFKGEAALVAFGFALIALSPSWFLVGLNRPRSILLIETIPKILLNIVAALIIGLGGPLVAFGITTILCGAVPVAGMAIVFRTRLIPRAKSFADGFQTIAQHFPLSFGRTVSVLYTTVPVSIVSIASPESLPLFSAAERLMRMFLAVLAGIPSRLQSWVGGPKDRASVVRRSSKSLLFNALLGVLAATLFSLTAPSVAVFVFSDTIQIPVHIAALAGAVVGSICVSRGFGLSLVAERGANWISSANIAAAVSGVGAAALLVAEYGAAGGFVSILAAESIGVLVQAIILMLLRRRLSKSTAGTAARAGLL